LLLSLPLAFLLSGNAVCNAQGINPIVCKIYGSVFIEDDPKKADFIVYVESSEAFADLIVYKQNNRLFADKAGLWYMTEKRDIADFRIYLKEEKRGSDFTIYFTTTESFAGCPK
jgi:Family of unknown function (DUF6150)